jgi:hypothetical protein
MPETAMNEHRDAAPAENNIRGSRKITRVAGESQAESAKVTL